MPRSKDPISLDAAVVSIARFWKVWSVLAAAIAAGVYGWFEIELNTKGVGTNSAAIVKIISQHEAAAKSSADIDKSLALIDMEFELYRADQERRETERLSLQRERDKAQAERDSELRSLMEQLIQREKIGRAWRDGSLTRKPDAGSPLFPIIDFGPLGPFADARPGSPRRVYQNTPIRNGAIDQSCRCEEIAGPLRDLFCRPIER